LRIACGATGRDGAVVTRHVYHGVTAALADLSPEQWPAGNKPAHVTRIPPAWSDDDLEAALARRPPAATFLDAGLGLLCA
jgi:4-aminobutyrate aminotransferase-like enzyme